MKFFKSNLWAIFCPEVDYPEPKAFVFGHVNDILNLLISHQVASAV